MSAILLGIFKVARAIPFLAWAAIAFACWALLATHRASDFESDLKAEKAAEVQRVAEALELQQKESSTQLQQLQEKLDEQSKDLAATRVAAANGDAALARLRVALKSTSDRLHTPGTDTLATIRAAGDIAASVAGQCVEQYRRLGDIAADAVTRGLECERRSDAAIVAP